MSENFELNEKFWSMDGILGRRGFIINILIIQIITTTYITPIVYFVLFKPELMLNFVIMQPESLSYFHSWYLIFILCSLLIECILLYPSIVRRVRDIAADDDINRITLISSALIAVIFLASLPFASLISSFNLNWISLAIIVLLMCIPGKITSDKPASELIKFNWGAFLGTWYWGIYNKAFKTLFMIPLLLTGYAWFPFMILCGLKGNEWARKNNTEKPIEDFHSGQKAQTIAFIFIAPLLSVLLFMLVSISIGMSAIKYVKTHPEVKTKIEALNDRYIEVSMKMYFSKVELADAEGENKFYMDPKIWVNLSEDAKRKAFDAAVTYVKMETRKALEDAENKANKDDKEEIEEFTKAEIARNVKILSTFNNEVLAVYEIDKETLNKLYSLSPERKITFKEYLDYQKNAYKFNNRPTLP